MSVWLKAEGKLRNFVYLAIAKEYRKNPSIRHLNRTTSLIQRSLEISNKFIFISDYPSIKKKELTASDIRKNEIGLLM
jgi:hypothetical protein